MGGVPASFFLHSSLPLFLTCIFLIFIQTSCFTVTDACDGNESVDPASDCQPFPPEEIIIAEQEELNAEDKLCRKISWKNSDVATSYEVSAFCGETELTNCEPEAGMKTNANFLSVERGSNSEICEYRVKSCTASGCGLWSDEISISNSLLAPELCFEYSSLENATAETPPDTSYCVMADDQEYVVLTNINYIITWNDLNQIDKAETYQFSRWKYKPLALTSVADYEWQYSDYIPYGSTTLTGIPYGDGNTDYGQIYEFRVRACRVDPESDSEACSPWNHNPIRLVVLPPQITELRCDDCQSSSDAYDYSSVDGDYTISWDSIPGSTGYRVLEEFTALSLLESSDLKIPVIEASYQSDENIAKAYSEKPPGVYEYSLQACVKKDDGSDLNFSSEPSDADLASHCSPVSESIIVYVSRASDANLRIDITDLYTHNNQYVISWDKMSFEDGTEKMIELYENKTGITDYPSIQETGDFDMITCHSREDFGNRVQCTVTGKEYGSRYTYKLKIQVNEGDLLDQYELQSEYVTVIVVPRTPSGISSRIDDSLVDPGKYTIIWSDDTGNSGVSYELQECSGLCSEELSWRELKCNTADYADSCYESKEFSVDAKDSEYFEKEYQYRVRACTNRALARTCGPFSEIHIVDLRLDSPVLGYTRLDDQINGEERDYKFEITWDQILKAASYKVEERSDTGNWVAASDCVVVSTAICTKASNLSLDRENFVYRVSACIESSNFDEPVCGEPSEALVVDVVRELKIIDSDDKSVVLDLELSLSSFAPQTIDNETEQYKHVISWDALGQTLAAEGNVLDGISGGCSDPSYTTQDTCEVAEQKWSTNSVESCDTNVIYEIKQEFRNFSSEDIEYTGNSSTVSSFATVTVTKNIGFCSDPSYTTSEECQNASLNWEDGVCKDSNYTTQATCKVASLNWHNNYEFYLPDTMNTTGCTLENTTSCISDGTTPCDIKLDCKAREYFKSYNYSLRACLDPQNSCLEHVNFDYCLPWTSTEQKTDIPEAPDFELGEAKDDTDSNNGSGDNIYESDLGNNYVIEWEGLAWPLWDESNSTCSDGTTDQSVCEATSVKSINLRYKLQRREHYGAEPDPEFGGEWNDLGEWGPFSDAERVLKEVSGLYDEDFSDSAETVYQYRFGICNDEFSACKYGETKRARVKLPSKLQVSSETSHSSPYYQITWERFDGLTVYDFRIISAYYQHGCETITPTWDSGTSICSDSRYSDMPSCEEARPVWTEAFCSNSDHKSKDACETNGLSWTDSYCSDTNYRPNRCKAITLTWDSGTSICSDSRYSDQTSCEAAMPVWAEGFCSNSGHNFKDDCVANGFSWTDSYCSDTSYHQNRCETITPIWDSGTSTCSDSRNSDQTSCEAAMPVWTEGFCSNSGHNFKDDCVADGFSWTDSYCSDASHPQNRCKTITPIWDFGTSTCSDGRYSDETDCINATPIWTPAYCSDASIKTAENCVSASETWTSGDCSDINYENEYEDDYKFHINNIDDYKFHISKPGDIITDDDRGIDNNLKIAGVPRGYSYSHNAVPNASSFSETPTSIIIEIEKILGSYYGYQLRGCVSEYNKGEGDCTGYTEIVFGGGEQLSLHGASDVIIPYGISVTANSGDNLDTTTSADYFAYTGSTYKLSWNTDLNLDNINLDNINYNVEECVHDPAILRDGGCGVDSVSWSRINGNISKITDSNTLVYSVAEKAIGTYSYRIRICNDKDKDRGCSEKVSQVTTVLVKSVLELKPKVISPSTSAKYELFWDAHFDLNDLSNFNLSYSIEECEITETEECESSGSVWDTFTSSIPSACPSEHNIDDFACVTPCTDSTGADSTEAGCQISIEISKDPVDFQSSFRYRLASSTGETSSASDKLSLEYGIIPEITIDPLPGNSSLRNHNISWASIEGALVYQIELCKDNICGIISSCLDPSVPPTWNSGTDGICSDGRYSDQTSCENASEPSWDSITMCDDTRYSDESSCKAAPKPAWIPANTCSNPSYTTQASCEDATVCWIDLNSGTCSDTIHKDRSSCQRAYETWTSDDLNSGTCSDDTYTDSLSCENADETWVPIETRSIINIDRDDFGKDFSYRIRSCNDIDCSTSESDTKGWSSDEELVVPALALNLHLRQNYGGANDDGGANTNNHYNDLYIAGEDTEYDLSFNSNEYQVRWSHETEVNLSSDVVTYVIYEYLIPSNATVDKDSVISASVIATTPTGTEDFQLFGDIQNQATCEAVALPIWNSGTDAICSDGRYSDQTSCENTSEPSWDLGASTCSDGRYPDEESCNAAPEPIWIKAGACSDGTTTVQEDCENAAEPKWDAVNSTCTDDRYTISVWDNKRFKATFKLFTPYCSDIIHDNKTDCEAASEKWNSRYGNAYGYILLVCPTTVAEDQIYSDYIAADCLVENQTGLKLSIPLNEVTGLEIKGDALGDSKAPSADYYVLWNGIADAGGYVLKECLRGNDPMTCTESTEFSVQHNPNNSKQLKKRNLYQDPKDVADRLGKTVYYSVKPCSSPFDSDPSTCSTGEYTAEVGLPLGLENPSLKLSTLKLDATDLADPASYLECFGKEKTSTDISKCNVTNKAGSYKLNWSFVDGANQYIFTELQNDSVISTRYYELYETGVDTNIYRLYETSVLNGHRVVFESGNEPSEGALLTLSNTVETSLRATAGEIIYYFSIDYRIANIASDEPTPKLSVASVIQVPDTHYEIETLSDPNRYQVTFISGHEPDEGDSLILSNTVETNLRATAGEVSYDFSLDYKITDIASGTTPELSVADVIQDIANYMIVPNVPLYQLQNDDSSAVQPDYKFYKIDAADHSTISATPSTEHEIELSKRGPTAESYEYTIKATNALLATNDSIIKTISLYVDLVFPK